MIYVNEIDLFELGQLWGVVGELMPGWEKKLADALDRSGCTCVLFCYRGEQDEPLVRFLQMYAKENAAVRLVFINNEQEVHRLTSSEQKSVDKIYAWVDMVLRSAWPMVDLPICVGVHSDATICLTADKGVSLLQKLRALRCIVYKL